MRFLIDALEDLDKSFKKENGRLFVFVGDPVKVFRTLFQEWGIKMLTFEQDPEPIWQPRDNAVKRLCEEMNVEWVEKISHTLWDPVEILENNGGRPPHTYMLFNQVAGTIGDPPRPEENPNFSKVTFQVQDDHDNRFRIPDLQTFGIDQDDAKQKLNSWKGGESQALKLFKNRIEVETKAFTKGCVMQNQAQPDLVSVSMSLSPHLRFGCLSVRKLYWALRDAYIEHNPHRPFTISVVGQFMWREYFYTMSFNNINFNKMKGNNICLQIEWYSDPEQLQKWEKGETGYPWIDAIMKQLVQEGWIHHVARHAVSTFLTRGDLWIDWEEGLKIFDKYLIDADWSVNAGNWMWMSSSAFEKVLQCPKCFCPVRYGRKMNPQGEFVRRYLPVLKDMPLRYLFEPWKAPRAVQETAKCIVGVDYPSPIVDHNKASKDCYYKMMEVKNKMAALDKEVIHCSAASREEVQSFVWLPLGHHGDKGISEESLCDGFEGL